MLLHVESSLFFELLFLACNLTFVLSVRYFSFLKKNPTTKNPVVNSSLKLSLHMLQI